jgi:hypothetical protein
MTDLEQELRRLGIMAEEQVSVSPRMAEEVLRRSSLRRVVTAVTGAALLAVLVVGSFAGVRMFTGPASIGPAGPAPSPVETPELKTALEQLRSYDEPSMRKPNEVDPSTLEVQAHLVVETPSGLYLLHAATGVDSRGEPRAHFGVFEAQPDNVEWWPLRGFDAGLTVDRAEVDVLEVPGGDAYLGFVEAPETALYYKTKDRGWRPLGVRGPAGFVPLPADSADPPDVEGRRS